MEKRRRRYIKNKLGKKQLFKYYKKVKIYWGGLRDIQIRRMRTEAHVNKIRGREKEVRDKVTE